MKNNDIIIRREEEKDYRETENLVREAFWNVYTDPELYFVADKNPEAFEQFDRTFPEKQKLKLPGQLF